MQNTGNGNGGIDLNKIMKLKKGEIYKIDWIDTFHYTGWYTEEEIVNKAKDAVMVEGTIGYFVMEENDLIVLAMSQQGNPDFAQWNGPKWIPKGCIKKIKKLK